MKRILALILCLSTLLSLVACSSSLESGEAAEETKETETLEKKTAEEEIGLPDGDIVLPAGFSVGYCRLDMTPDLPMPYYQNQVATGVQTPVQMTVTAISDGAEIFLLFSLDMRGMRKEMVSYTIRMINQKLDLEIPESHVFMNSTHTHTSPDPDALGNSDYVRFQKDFYHLAPIAVKTALQDLTPTSAYVGSSLVEEGVTFVRRRVMEDGLVQINTTAQSGAQSYESQPDRELRTIRFDRGDKRDVLLINYQTHHRGIDQKNVLSADWIHDFRESVEDELDVDFAYVQGAAGNLNFMGAFDDQKYDNPDDTIASFMTTVKDSLSHETPAATGSLRFAHSEFPGRLANANKDGDSGSVRNLPFWAVSFGEIGIAAAPYEMFDTNGVWIRENSPFPMTFVSAYTNDRNGYVPSALAYPNRGYEVVDGTSYAPGSGEEFAAELVRLLNECKNAQ